MFVNLFFSVMSFTSAVCIMDVFFFDGAKVIFQVCDLLYRFFSLNLCKILNRKRTETFEIMCISTCVKTISDVLQNKNSINYTKINNCINYTLTIRS